jgi:hypothetical protein
MIRIHVFAAVLFMSGCTALANSPMVIYQLKVRSAGFTGCAVDANVITNVTGNTDGSGTWARPDDCLTRLNVASNRTNDRPWMGRAG